MGRAAAKDWLDAHYDDIGVTGTLDTRMAFAGRPKHQPT
jgi:hypothetical protein